MAKENFTSRLKRGRLVLDGATGSNLQKRGMPAGVCPEEWILNNKEVLKKLQKEYIQKTLTKGLWAFQRKLLRKLVQAGIFILLVILP